MQEAAQKHAWKLRRTLGRMLPRSLHSELQRCQEIRHPSFIVHVLQRHRHPGTCLPGFVTDAVA
eukprot:4151466-Alexandrium_andersonii.AAC.1